MQPRRASPLPRDAGLSLIEILVGISILSIVAFAVALSVQSPADPLGGEADRLAARLRQAEQEAVASGQPVGLVITQFGSRYDFYRYLDGRWWPLAGGAGPAGHTLDGGLRLSLPAAVSGAEAIAPVRRFDPAGLTEPFSLRLDSADAWTELRWTGDGALVRQGEA